MSYEKVKCITRKPKEGKIFITSASNNVRPLTYSRWELMKDETDYHKKELELLLGINGGGLSLNGSCYEWLYALYKANEELGRDYNLWDLARHHYDIYVVGEKISSSWIEITKSELTDDFILDYTDKQGRYKTYYKQSVKEAEDIAINKALEDYYKVFMKYFDEAYPSKYYLYSKSYGYVEPKGTQGAFRYSYSSHCKTLMSYKQAYCLMIAIDRDMEIMEEGETNESKI